MDEAQWLEARKKGLGGSEISSVVGLNPYSSPWQVYLDKIGAGRPVPESTPMRLGKLVEPLLTALYQRAGRLTRPLLAPGLLFDERRPWWRGTPDRLDPAHGVGVEFKYTGRWMAKEWGPSGSVQVPLRHRLQCTWYLALTGYIRWDLLVCIGGEDLLAAAGWEVALTGAAALEPAWLDRLLDQLDLRCYPILPDAELIALLADEGGRFWHDHVVPRVPPELDGSEAAVAYLLDRYPTATEAVRPATAPEAQLLSDYRDADTEADAWLQEKARLAAALMQTIGPARGVLGSDGTKALWSPVAGGTQVDWQGLARALGATSEQIAAFTTRRATTRRFTVTAPRQRGGRLLHP